MIVVDSTGTSFLATCGTDTLTKSAFGGSNYLFPANSPSNFATAISFALASISTVIFFRRQHSGKSNVDKVVMSLRLRAVPAFNRAGNVEHWLPVLK